jgi:hypothetical protein
MSSKDSVAIQFIAVTGASLTVANEYLKKTGYFLERAVDMYYAASGKKSKAVLEKFFRELTNGESNLAGENLIQLITACKSDVTDPVWLAVAQVCGAKEAASFTQDEWIQGMRSLNVSNLNELKMTLPDLKKRAVGRSQEAKNMYRFAFTYTLDHGSRNLKIEDALALWELLLEPLRWPLYGRWVEFISQRGAVVTKDTWNLVYELATNVKSDLSDFDSAGAWPVTIDDFVEVVKSSDY